MRILTDLRFSGILSLKLILNQNERTDKTLKKYIIHILLALTLLFLLCSCDADSFIDIFTGESGENYENSNVADDEKHTNEQYDAAALLESVTSEYVVDFFAADYDLDQVQEVYALTSKNAFGEGEVHMDGISLWFIKNDKVIKLLDSGDYSLSPELWRFSDKILFCIDEYVDDVPYSKVFFVSGSGAYSYGDFGAKLVRAGDDSNDFYAWVDAQDSVYRIASSEFSESALKPYYLYFDGNFFCEYAGLIIREEELRAVDGADEILTAISGGGYTIGDIYYRDNGIININISKENGGIIMRENVTLMLSGEGVHLVPRGESFSVLTNAENAELSQKITDGSFEDLQAFSYGGHYSAAVLVELATYPLEFER